MAFSSRVVCSLHCYSHLGLSPHLRLKLCGHETLAPILLSPGPGRHHPTLSLGAYLSSEPHISAVTSFCDWLLLRTLHTVSRAPLWCRTWRDFLPFQGAGMPCCLQMPHLFTHSFVDAPGLSPPPSCGESCCCEHGGTGTCLTLCSRFFGVYERTQTRWVTW